MVEYLVVDGGLDPDGAPHIVFVPEVALHSVDTHHALRMSTSHAQQ